MLRSQLVKRGVKVPLGNVAVSTCGWGSTKVGALASCFIVSSTRRGMSDAIATLDKDHNTVLTLIEKTLFWTSPPEAPSAPPIEPPAYSASPGVQLDPETQRDTIRELVREITAHEAIENRMLLPLTEVVLRDGRHIAQRIRNTHREVMDKVKRLNLHANHLVGPPETWPALPHDQIQELRNAFQAHITEQEQNLFPLLRRVLTSEKLTELAHDLEVARAAAPTEPESLTETVGESIGHAMAGSMSHHTDSHVRHGTAANS